MPNPNLNAEVLLNIGFVDIAGWEADGAFLTYRLGHRHADKWLDEPNALYAFVSGGDVQYIGKTARSIRRRFTGYCRPGPTQSTNVRCHRKIKEAISEGAEIRILVFTPIAHFRYADFEINLAADLEDSLIKEFKPPWNGHKRGQPFPRRKSGKRPRRRRRLPMRIAGLLRTSRHEVWRPSQSRLAPPTTILATSTPGSMPAAISGAMENQS